MKQLSLERECSRLRQEVDRLAVLQPLLEGQLCVHACQSHTHSTHHSLLSCDIHTAAFAKHAITLQPLCGLGRLVAAIQHSAHFPSQNRICSL